MFVWVNMCHLNRKLKQNYFPICVFEAIVIGLYVILFLCLRQTSIMNKQKPKVYCEIYMYKGNEQCIG